jgi:multimeric flavodoxin WrbA
VVLLGTSRSGGNTRIVVDKVLAGKSVTVVDLKQIDMSAYDYEHGNASDGFIPLIEGIAMKPFWVLATPVYWYTMSTQMKMFVDRLSDLITLRKDLGRLLRGKQVVVLASGTDDELPPGFESPFKLTCDYLGMNYAGAFYAKFSKDDEPAPASDAAAAALRAAWMA